MSLPVRLGGGNRPMVELGHWADGSSRNSFKLYSGNRSADGIARAMLFGVREKPKKGATLGEIRTRGIRQLWEEQKDACGAALHVLAPMVAASISTRAGMDGVDADILPNDQGHSRGLPLSILAAWGRYARPDEFETRRVRYAAWDGPLPPCSPGALCGGAP
jgi:CRISPR-associated protein Csx14